MEYVLQYFEEFLDEYYMQDNDKHTYLGSNLYLEIDVEEVSTESQKILKELRKVFYSVRPQSEIDEYLGKVFKRLLTIKRTMEEISDFIETVLVLDNLPKSNFSILRNFKSMYKGVHYVLTQIVYMNGDLQSNLGENESLKYRIRRTDTAEIIKRHEMLKNYVENNIEMKIDLIKEYNIVDLPSVSGISVGFDYWKGQQSYFSSYVFDFERDDFDLTLKDYASRFYHRYIKLKKGYEKRFYAQVGLHLKKKTFEFKEEKLQVDFIVDFLVFNNLCHDLVLGYFKGEVYKKIVSQDYMELFNYINDQVERLEELQESNTIKYFNSVLIGKKTKTTLNNKLQIFLKTLIRELTPKENPDLNAAVGEKNEQMVFEGTGECLGLFYSLLFDVNLIKKNGAKKRVSRILSKTTLVGKDVEAVKPITIYAAFNSKGRSNEKEHIDYLMKKVLHMLEILKKMKN